MKRGMNKEKAREGYNDPTSVESGRRVCMCASSLMYKRGTKWSRGDGREATAQWTALSRR